MNPGYCIAYGVGQFVQFPITEPEAWQQREVNGLSRSSNLGVESVSKATKLQVLFHGLFKKNANY